VPTREDELKWWRCKDFSPGIVRATQRSALSAPTAVTATAPDGSASSARGCLASPTGALIPGWHLIRTNLVTSPHNNWGAGYRPQDETGFDFLIGTAIAGPAIGSFSKTTSNRAADGTADQVFMVHSNFYDPTNTGQYVGHSIWRTTFWSTASALSSTQFVQDNDNADNPGGITGTDARRVRGWMTSGYGAPWNDGTTNFNTVPPVNEPNPFWFVASHGGSTECDVIRLLYPNPDVFTYGSMSDDNPVAGSPGLSGDFAAYHAGRLLVGGNQGYGLFGHAHLLEGSVAQFDIVYTGEFEFSSKSATPITALSVLLQDSQLSKAAALCSVNANTLFIQMDTSGSYMIQGDLDRPQVTHLPGVPSAYGMAAIPVVSSKGVVITSRNGVYVWNQGSDASLISAQLPGDFWISSTWDQQRRHGASKGKLGYSDPFVTVPNDYVLDTRNGSWWQMQRRATANPFFHYETGAAGHVYAFPEYRDQTHTQVFSVFDPHTMAYGPNESYSWQSNPIADLTAIGRDINVREVELELSGSGTVAVAVVTGDTLNIATFDVDSTWPVKMRHDMSARSSASLPSGIGAQGVSLLIDAQGLTGSTNPLPIVHSVGLGWMQGTSTRPVT
jgi:hypothetical protein